MKISYFLHFFQSNQSNKISWYRKFFPTKSYKNKIEKKTKQNFVVGENTSTYLFHPLVPKRIKEILPNAKLIINLRNPVKRAFSNYNQQVINGNTNTADLTQSGGGVPAAGGCIIFAYATE